MYAEGCAAANSGRIAVKPATHTEQWLDLKDPKNQMEHVEAGFWDHIKTTAGQVCTAGER